MEKKQWYEVSLQTMKIVRVFAIDEEDAQCKAEQKVNKNNAKWMADEAWLVSNHE